LESGVPAVGAWLSLESEQLAETLSYAGFDTVTVDVQHGMFDLGRAIALLRAVLPLPAGRCAKLRTRARAPQRRT
jgi:4-hydroxy-2-oxoheptanedioate aldolase